MSDTAFIPLYQTLLWVVVVFGILLVLRKDIVRLRDALVRRVEQGAALDVGPVKFGELRAEIRMVREDLSRVESVVAQLFLATMSEPMFRNLEKFASGNFGPYHLGDALARELYHLRDAGYIQVGSIRQIPQNGPQLSQFVVVTQAGRQFVELRTRFLPPTP